MADYTYSQRPANVPRRYWWKNTQNVYDDVFAAVRWLKEQQKLRRNRLLRNLRLYGNLPYAGLTIDNYFRTDDEIKSANRLTLNVVKSMVDTMANRIAKNKPLPTFLTEGGSWDQQLKAKRLQKFIKGQFYKMDAYELGRMTFSETCIFGTGIVKTFRVGNDVKLERVFPAEIHIDEEEAFYGQPRQCFQEKHLPREVLLNAYPEFEAKILDAGKESDRSNEKKIADHVAVVEAWHLPAQDDKKDGRHVIAIDNCVLLDEPYTRDKFPFTFLHYTKPPIGFWGIGLTDELVGIQIEINKLLRTIQRAMHLLSIPKVFIEKASKIVKSHFNNEVGGIITYSGVKPEVHAFNAVSPELFAQLDRLYARAYEITGISQLSAQGLKPEGLDSGKAIRTFNDIQTERFILNGQAYEEFYLDIADQIIDIAKEIYEDDKSFGVMAVGKRQVERIRWSEVDMDKDKYSMRVFPTSALAETPSARLQEVQELVQAGFIEKDTAVQLLDMPDLENTYSDLTAQGELMELVIDSIIGKGAPRFIAPDPTMNLEFGIRRIRNAYLRGKINNIPEQRLSLLSQWIAQAEALMSRAAQPDPQIPGAVPMAPPRSDLLPHPTPLAQAPTV